MICAADHDTFKDSWKSFVETFSRQQGHILRYIQKEYMPWRKQWVKSYINRYRNFGQRVNSPTETAHADVNSHPVTGTGDPLYLHQPLSRWLITSLSPIVKRLRDRFSVSVSVNQYLKQAWLGKLNLQITYPAIDLIAKQLHGQLRALIRPSLQPLYLWLSHERHASVTEPDCYALVAREAVGKSAGHCHKMLVSTAY